VALLHAKFLSDIKWERLGITTVLGRIPLGGGVQHVGSGAPCRRTNAEEFLNANGNIQRLLTPESVYMVRISKYNRGARSMNVAPLRPAQLLSVSDNTDVEAEKRQLRDMLAESQEVIHPTCPTALCQCPWLPDTPLGYSFNDSETKDREARGLLDQVPDCGVESTGDICLVRSFTG
jgi:hypothetical protein